MLQAAVLDRHFFDLFPFSDNGFVTSEVDVSGCDVVQALMVTPALLHKSERDGTSPFPGRI